LVVEWAQKQFPNRFGGKDEKQEGFFKAGWGKLFRYIFGKSEEPVEEPKKDNGTLNTILISIVIAIALGRRTIVTIRHRHGNSNQNSEP
jgi:hypothetical protein